nr:uncharacterized protein LOC105472303 isoform X1 [Macaca nemestrina]
MTLSDTAGSEQIQYLGILFLRIPDHQKLCQWSCWRPQNFFLSMTPASPHILKCTFNAVLRKHASYVCPVLGQCLPQSMTLRGLSSLRLAAHEKHARAAADSAGEPPQLEEAKLGSKRMQPSCFSALCSLQLRMAQLVRDRARFSNPAVSPKYPLLPPLNGSSLIVTCHTELYKEHYLVLFETTEQDIQDSSTRLQKMLH